MTTRLCGSRGQTMMELMVACTLLLIIMGALVALAVPAHGAFRQQPEMADLQQRLRVAVDAMHRDLAAAGAGFTIGPSAGALTRVAPAILPYRLEMLHSGGGAPGTARTDAITILSLPSIAIQCETGQSMAGPSAPIALRLAANCPLYDAACGFEPGMAALIGNGFGAWDAFVISGVQASSSLLEHAPSAVGNTYAHDSLVSALSVRAYYLRNDPSSGTPQLMRSDGAGSNLPLCEHVVGLQFELLGNPDPPRLIRPLTDPVGPWTSYGPLPPGPGVQDDSSPWPPGENCVYRLENDQQVSRLASLPSAGASMVRLDAAILTDGPWCPNPGAPNRYDADLLRVRMIRLSIRAEAASEIVRGLAAPQFARPGSAIGAASVPDQVITLDVSPRNLRQESRP